MADEKEKLVSPFPADCDAKYPHLHVFGQMSDKTTADDIKAFFSKFGLETEYAGVSVNAAATETAPADGFVVLKVKNIAQHSVIPFGMILAIAEGAKDFIVIHPQVFVTFYQLPAEPVVEAAPQAPQAE